MNKTCKICNINKDQNEFYTNGFRNGKQRIKSWCKTCEYIKDMTVFKSKLLKFFGKLCCSKCKYDKYFSVLEFHHLDPEIKEVEISRLRNYSYDKLKVELEKCVLLCANCHREEHILLRLNKGLHSSM